MSGRSQLILALSAQTLAAAAGWPSDGYVIRLWDVRTQKVIDTDQLVGLQRSGTKYKTEPDREAAIALAIHEARA